MSRRLLPMLGLIGTAAVVLLILVLLGWPSPAPAQKAAEPTTPANMPPGHVGAEMCKNCHEEAFNRFSNTKMGRLFLKQPRNSEEASGCESCHGPGKDHVDAGGKGAIITFAKNDPTPVEKRNADVPVVPHQGQPGVLDGQLARGAQRRLHQLPHSHGESLLARQPRQGDRDRDVRELPSAEARDDDAVVAHAAARGQDDLHRRATTRTAP